MGKDLSIRIKAAVLLIVFSLNTIIGFACTIGVDMGYNKHHHEVLVKTHKGCKGHPVARLNTTTRAKFIGAHDDCCSNAVTIFNLSDKAVLNNSIDFAAPVFDLTPIFLTYTESQSIIFSPSSKAFRFVRRSCFLNDTDIHIAIRSFLI